MDWVGLGWVGLGWVGLDWVGLDWVGLGWVGLDWIGLDWEGLGVVRLGWFGCKTVRKNKQTINHIIKVADLLFSCPFGRPCRKSSTNIWPTFVYLRKLLLSPPSPRHGAPLANKPHSPRSNNIKHVSNKIKQWKQ